MILQIPNPISEEHIAGKADTARVAARQFAQTLVEDPHSALQQLGQVLIDFGLKLLAALAIYLIGAWLIKRVKKLLKRVFERKKTDRAMATFVTSFVTIALTVVLIVITIGALGVNTTSLAALLAAGGLAVGMALSGTLQNFAGGLMIMAFKPFKAGDYIEALGYAGTVTEVTIVGTHLTTVDNRRIILPNGALSNGNIANYTTFPLRRIDLQVNVEYGTDTARCKETLSGIIKADRRILDSSAEGAADPMVAVQKLSESSVTFVVRVWVRTKEYWDVYFDLNERIYDTLPKAGIHFPFPQMDVHIRTGGKES